MNDEAESLFDRAAVEYLNCDAGVARSTRRERPFFDIAPLVNVVCDAGWFHFGVDVQRQLRA